MAGTAIGAAIGGGFGIANTAITNHFAQIRADRDRQQNFAYNEQSAENAYNRQRALMEEYMTPEAQIRHLKAAGLSPSLMYGAGGGTQGVSTPAGGGGGNIQTPTTGIDVTAINQLAQIANLEAQTRKTNAEADTEEGLNKRGEEEINKIVAETGGTEALKAKNEAETNLTNIDVEIKDATKKDVIFTIKSQADEAYEKAQFAALQVAEKTIDLEIKQSTMQDLIKQCKTKTIQMANELVLQRKEADLKEAQIQEIANHIAQKWQELAISKGELSLKNKIYTLDKSKFKFEQFKFNKTMTFELEKFNKGVEFEAHKQKVNAITDIMTKYGTALIYGGLLKNIGTKTSSIITDVQAPIKVNPLTVPNGYENLLGR